MIRQIPPIVILGALLIVSPARAQVDSYFVYSAETGQDRITLHSIGAGVLDYDRGWSPTFGVTGLYLSFPLSSDTETTRWILNPSAGLRYQGSKGAASASVGYSWLSSERTTSPQPVPTGARSGWTGSVLVDYLPTAQTTFQGIGSYNVSDHYIWSRARGSTHLVGSSTLAARLGAEILGQTETDPPADREAYQAFQAGPLVELQLGRNTRMSTSAGFRWSDGGVEDGRNSYMKVELLWLP